MKPLDLDAVRAFVLVAELASFTRAADALGTTQSAVSLKLKRLEAQLGKPLLERTPRRVTLAAVGAAFLPAARELLDAHERALAALSSAQRRLVIGVSEHVAVPDLPAVLTGLNRHDPGLALEMHVGMSAGLLAQYDERRLDAAFVRHEPGEDPPRDDATLPLAVLAGPCGVRAAALRALERAGVRWRERFTGGGVAAVAAAAAAGLAVCPLARRVAPRSLVDVGARLRLPALPDSQVALYSRVRDARSIDTLRRFADSLAGPAQSAGRE
ncbi:LysR family transcriptional regulator [Burkholderia pseudomallei]|uniref:LysR family transcriptional regulator n=1 Tax=Burkholderia pseudomallei TaxID=28450 RepID=UPI000F06510B|nr:LysR family transcriptional regulator [Burkholderia pseudomallei]CAJ3052097.1 LysR family transcriptional regulator [Burkholderia pseudomallei]VBD87388.1 LysR family transcriptional regulator [Burkholderia pseudomallei]VBO84976.1 LysR family transcriptional regulator [Burkholderia pseudomallei]VBW43145.1 LysR family transcriptional regulator [Burkholderia pseudomallei]VCL85285.1 LysR family transcriptional regulator [Burkholderia pseudomallei]